VLQKLNYRPKRGLKQASGSAVGGNTAIVQGTIRNVAGGQIQQVAV